MQKNKTKQKEKKTTLVNNNKLKLTSLVNWKNEGRERIIWQSCGIIHQTPTALPLSFPSHLDILQFILWCQEDIEAELQNEDMG